MACLMKKSTRNRVRRVGSGSGEQRQSYLKLFKELRPAPCRRIYSAFSFKKERKKKKVVVASVNKCDVNIKKSDGIENGRQSKQVIQVDNWRRK